MKFIKVFSVLLFSFLFMWVCAPELSAKEHHSHKRHYHKHKHKYYSRSSRFALNFNVNPVPNYVEYNYLYPTPGYVVAPRPVVEQRVYYPYYAPQPVVVQPSYSDPIYVQPSYSYWRY